jgi:hypothetical protein
VEQLGDSVDAELYRLPRQGCSSFGAGVGSRWTPERGAVMQKVRELVEFARGQGYAVDELVEMIEGVA